MQLNKETKRKIKWNNLKRIKEWKDVDKIKEELRSMFW